MKVVVVACLNSICPSILYRRLCLKMVFKHATAAPVYAAFCKKSFSICKSYTPGRMGEAEDGGDSGKGILRSQLEASVCFLVAHAYVFTCSQEGDYQKAAQHFCMALDLRPGFLQETLARLLTHVAFRAQSFALKHGAQKLSISRLPFLIHLLFVPTSELE